MARDRRVVRKCTKCDRDRVPGTGQKYCEEHRLTDCVKPSSPMGQQAMRMNIKASKLIKMYEERDYRCDICGKEETGRMLSVDHDHACCPSKRSCGECARGLLCNRCNRALGLFGDDVTSMRNAITYLEGYTR